MTICARSLFPWCSARAYSSITHPVNKLVQQGLASENITGASVSLWYKPLCLEVATAMIIFHLVDITNNDFALMFIVWKSTDLS